MDVKIECSNSTHYSGKHRNCRRCCLPDRTALASSNTHDNEGRIESSVLTLNDSEGAERKIWLCLVVEKDLRQRFISRVWLIVHRHEACTLPLSKASAECKQTVQQTFKSQRRRGEETCSEAAFSAHFLQRVYHHYSGNRPVKTGCGCCCYWYSLIFRVDYLLIFPFRAPSAFQLERTVPSSCLLQ